ncbi:hypothetical protein TorRG33x02_326490, partial [Trema orientale]
STFHLSLSKLFQQNNFKQPLVFCNNIIYLKAQVYESYLTYEAMHTSWNSIRSNKNIGNRYFMPTSANRTHLARIKDKHKEPLKTWDIKLNEYKISQVDHV